METTTLPRVSHGQAGTQLQAQGHRHSPAHWEQHFPGEMEATGCYPLPLPSCHGNSHPTGCQSWSEPSCFQPVDALQLWEYRECWRNGEDTGDMSVAP